MKRIWLLIGIFSTLLCHSVWAQVATIETTLATDSLWVAPLATDSIPTDTLSSTLMETLEKVPVKVQTTLGNTFANDSLGSSPLAADTLAAPRPAPSVHRPDGGEQQHSSPRPDGPQRPGEYGAPMGGREPQLQQAGVVVADSLTIAPLATDSIMPNGSDGVPSDVPERRIMSPRERTAQQQQQPQQGGGNKGPVPLVFRMSQWRIDQLGNVKPIEVDTLHHQFQNLQSTDGMNGQYNYLGNVGSPRLNRIFFDRDETSQFLFLDPLDYFIVPTEAFNFSNTTIPYTNLFYHSAGNQTDGEDIFRTYFSVNANRRLAFGFTANYVYGRGVYNNQNTSLLNVSLFSTYRGDKYCQHFIFSNNHIKMAENGGIEDDNYITNPENMASTVTPASIPTQFDETWMRNDSYSLFYTHRYNIGRYQAPRDTTQTEREFVPVTAFIHTVQFAHRDRNYISYDTPDNFYVNDFMESDTTFDTTRYVALKNTVALSLCEGFNKYAKSGLTAFASYEMRSFSLPDYSLTQDSTFYRRKYSEKLLSIGAELAKKEGHTFHYLVRGEAMMAGAESGDYRLNGSVDLNFKLLGDTLRIGATGYIKNVTPTFYQRHYHSRHLWWDNSHFDRELRTRAEGFFTAKRWGTHIRVGVEQIKNYTYLSNANISQSVYRLVDAEMLQCADNIKVFSAIWQQNFKLGALHLDNEVAYQTSSNEEALPLPKLSLYHNLYFAFKVAKKVLSVEMGADVRYFTRYYAPDYLPAMGQFYTQDAENQIALGCYPIVNAYVNFHLKHTRIYLNVSHVNASMSNLNYFLAPHYPINPLTIKWGLSWNFFD